MRFYCCRANGVLGLLQVDGSPGQLPPPVSHPRQSDIAIRVAELAKTKYNAGTFPSVLDNCLARGWWPHPDLARLSKWCHHDSAAEDVARKLARLAFRCSDEEDFLLPRLLDQKNRPKNQFLGVAMTADHVFSLWVTHVVQSWGGRVEPALDFPTVQAARQHFLDNP